MTPSFPNMKCVFVFLGRSVAPSSPGPTSATLPEETYYWRTSMSTRKISQSAAGGEGVDQREGSSPESFTMWGKGKGESNNCFNETNRGRRRSSFNNKKITTININDQ